MFFKTGASKDGLFSLHPVVSRNVVSKMKRNLIIFICVEFGQIVLVCPVIPLVGVGTRHIEGRDFYTSKIIKTPAVKSLKMFGENTKRGKN